MATAKAPTHMATATTVSSATTAAGLRVGSNKAGGKHCTCQDHQHSSLHDILL
jgi:hypothetical protein